MLLASALNIVIINFVVGCQNYAAKIYLIILIAPMT